MPCENNCEQEFAAIDNDDWERSIDFTHATSMSIEFRGRCYNCSMILNSSMYHTTPNFHIHICTIIARSRILVLNFLWLNLSLSLYLFVFLFIVFLCLPFTSILAVTWTFECIHRTIPYTIHHTSLSDVVAQKEKRKKIMFHWIANNIMYVTRNACAVEFYSRLCGWCMCMVYRVWWWEWRHGKFNKMNVCSHCTPTLPQNLN